MLSAMNLSLSRREPQPSSGCVAGLATPAKREVKPTLSWKGAGEVQRD